MDLCESVLEASASSVPRRRIPTTCPHGARKAGWRKNKAAVSTIDIKPMGIACVGTGTYILSQVSPQKLTLQ